MRIKICPICAVVSVTWLLMTAGVLAGTLSFEDYQVPIAMLMGGTVVGVAYQGEKVLNWAKNNSMKFKTAVILVGFLLAYFALNSIGWVVFAVEIAVLGTVAWLYFVVSERATEDLEDPARVKEIEEKLKNCC